MTLDPSSSCDEGEDAMIPVSHGMSWSVDPLSQVLFAPLTNEAFRLPPLEYPPVADLEEETHAAPETDHIEVAE
jgi:hypothetical protein